MGEYMVGVDDLARVEDVVRVDDVARSERCG